MFVFIQNRATDGAFAAHPRVYLGIFGIRRHRRSWSSAQSVISKLDSRLIWPSPPSAGEPTAQQGGGRGRGGGASFCSRGGTTRAAVAKTALFGDADAKSVETRTASAETAALFHGPWPSLPDSQGVEGVHGAMCLHFIRVYVSTFHTCVYISMSLVHRPFFLDSLFWDEQQISCICLVQVNLINFQLIQHVFFVFFGNTGAMFWRATKTRCASATPPPPPGFWFFPPSSSFGFFVRDLCVREICSHLQNNNFTANSSTQIGM